MYRNTLKQISLTFILLFTVITVFAQQSHKSESSSQNPLIKDNSRGYIVEVGDQAPDDFELTLINGKKTSLKDLRGKIVILQFTASWCGVCRREMPHLERDVWQAYKNENVVLIGIDRDEPLEKVQKFSRDMKISYPLALDPAANIFGRFAHKESGVTRNVVIDPSGKIVFLTRLYDPQEFKKMVSVIDGLVSTSGKVTSR